jgi:hypothetical protein
MRREDITLDVSDAGWPDSEEDPRKPTLSLRLDDDADALSRRLVSEDGTRLDASEIDATVRLHGDPQESDATGVVAVTNRITGEYVLECNAGADAILEFTRAARRYGETSDDDALYRVELSASDDDGAESPVATYEKRTLLVYGETGELLREHSLIPSGVEI